jgi:hypothetical protein
VDPADAIVDELEAVATLDPGPSSSGLHLLTTGDRERFEVQARAWLGAHPFTVGIARWCGHGLIRLQSV